MHVAGLVFKLKGLHGAFQKLTAKSYSSVIQYTPKSARISILTMHMYMQKPNKIGMGGKNLENEGTIRALLFTCLLK